MKKKILIILSVVLLLAVGTAVVLAEGLLTDEQQDLFDQKVERVQELVKEGKITQEQADAYLAGFEQRLLDGTCQGGGAGCIEDEECEFGLGDDGECLGLGADYDNGIGCGFGGGRGCGK